MIEILLQREPTVGDSTEGRLYIRGRRLTANGRPMSTLEDPVREPVYGGAPDWKVPGRTAIPEGRYALELVNSPRFGPKTISLRDVPGFKYIRVHAGNTARDTEGCILVGEWVPGPSGGTVRDSRIHLLALKSIVRPALDDGEHVFIIVRNPVPLEIQEA